MYTPEEVSAYEYMLQGGNAEKAVTRQFSSFYCQETGECPPSRGTSGFKWQKLVNPGEAILEWWEDTKAKLLVWGSCWGIFCSILTGLHFISKLFIVFSSIGKRPLSGSTILKFVFLPGRELVNMFPPKPPVTEIPMTNREFPMTHREFPMTNRVQVPMRSSGMNTINPEVSSLMSSDAYDN
jgi:hypothetical protein